MFIAGLSRAATSGSREAVPANPQRYGKQVDESDDEDVQADVELGKAPAPSSGNDWIDIEIPASASTDSDTQDALPDPLAAEHRAGFVRKVYGILAAQMTLTCVICMCAMFIPPVRSVFVGLMSIPYATLLIFAPTICVLCALQAKKDQHPTNYYLLWTFTALMSVSLAGICALYQQAGLGYLILQAFSITAACFFGLSLYAMKSGKDFSWMGGMLSMGLLGMLMFAFMGWIFGFSGGILYSLFGVVLFCGFILYDTHRVMRVYGPDDAIMASVELYLDIVNLFLYILELLSAGNQQ